MVPTPEGLVPVYGAEMPLERLLRPYPHYGNVGINTNPDGFNRYHSLQSRFEKRFSHGLSFATAYTFQKNIGTPNTGSLIGNTATPTTLGRTVGRSAFVAGAISGGSGNGPSGGASAQDPDNRTLDVALTADDIPHVSLTLPPFTNFHLAKGKPFSGHESLRHVVLGGWRAHPELERSDWCSP